MKTHWKNCNETGSLCVNWFREQFFIILIKVKHSDVPIPHQRIYAKEILAYVYKGMSKVVRFRIVTVIIHK